MKWNFVGIQSGENSLTTTNKVFSVENWAMLLQEIIFKKFGWPSASGRCYKVTPILILINTYSPSMKSEKYLCA